MCTHASRNKTPQDWAEGRNRLLFRYISVVWRRQILKITWKYCILVLIGMMKFIQILAHRVEGMCTVHLWGCVFPALDSSQFFTLDFLNADKSVLLMKKPQEISDLSALYGFWPKEYYKKRTRFFKVIGWSPVLCGWKSPQIRSLLKDNGQNFTLIADMKTPSQIKTAKAKHDTSHWWCHSVDGACLLCGENKQKMYLWFGFATGNIVSLMFSAARSCFLPGFGLRRPPIRSDLENL